MSKPCKIKRKTYNPNRPESKEYTNRQSEQISFIFRLNFEKNEKKIKKIQQKEWYRMIKKIHTLQFLTWSQIISQGKDKYERIDINQIKVPIANPFNSHKVDVFKSSKAGRILGYRKDRFCYIVAIDPNHEYYNG